MGKQKRYQMRELVTEPEGITYGWEVFDTRTKEGVYRHMLIRKVQERMEQLNGEENNG